MLTIRYGIQGAKLGILLSLLNGGSMLLCLNTFGGEVNSSFGSFNILDDLSHSHLAYCVADRGVWSLIVIALAAVVPLSWIGAISSALVFVPQYAVLGAGLGLVADIIAVAIRSQSSSAPEVNPVKEQESIPSTRRVKFTPISPTSEESYKTAELLTEAFDRTAQTLQISPEELLLLTGQGDRTSYPADESISPQFIKDLPDERLTEEVEQWLEGGTGVHSKQYLEHELLDYQRQALSYYDQTSAQRRLFDQHARQFQLAERDALAALTKANLFHLYDSDARRVEVKDASQDALKAFSQQATLAVKASQGVQNVLRHLQQYRAARAWRRRWLLITVTSVILISSLGTVGFALFGMKFWQIKQHREAALAAINAGRFEEALIESEAWIALDAQDEYANAALKECHYRLTVAALEAGQWKKGRLHAETLLALEAGYRDAEILLRESYYQPAFIALTESRWPEARSILKQLLELDSEYKDSQILLRESYYRPAIAAIERQDWESAAESIASLRAVEMFYQDVSDLVLNKRDLRDALVVYSGKLWADGSSVITGRLAGPESGVASIAFSPDGKLLAAAGAGKQPVQLWQVSDRTLISGLQKDGGKAQSVSFSSDGNLLAAGIQVSSSSEVKLWQVKDYVQVGTLAKDNDVKIVAFSPDSTLLAIAADKEVQMWQVAYGSLIYTTEGDGRNLVEALAFSPDMTTFASGGGRSIKLWQVGNGNLERSWEVQTGLVTDLAFSPDGTLLAVLVENEITVWRAADGEQVRVIKKRGYTASSIAFSPDGTLLASAGNDVYLWRVADGTLVRTLEGEMRMSSVTFSQDGSVIAAGEHSGTIWLWQVAPPAE